MQAHLLSGPSREMRRVNRNLQLFARRVAGDGGRIDRQHIALVYNRRVVPEIFWGAVVIQEAVPFPFDVMQLCEDVGGKAAVAPQFVGEELEAPANIDVAIERPDAAVLAVDERLRTL